MQRFAISALVVAFAGIVPAAAQSVPEGYSCGGLLCDMGVFGHKTTPEPKNAAPSATVTEPAAVQKADAAPEPMAAEPKKSASRKKKRVAKAVHIPVPAEKQVAASKVAPPAVAVAKPAAAPAMAKAEPTKREVPKPVAQVVAKPVAAPAATAPAIAPPTAATAQAAPPAAVGATNILNPYGAPQSPQPATFRFRPIY